MSTTPGIFIGTIWTEGLFFHRAVREDTKSSGATFGHLRETSRVHRGREKDLEISGHLDTAMPEAVTMLHEQHTSLSLLKLV